MFALISILKFLIIIVPILLTVATLTLFERKVMAAIQIRRGPNVVGLGLLQPLADGLKLLIKELIIPLKGNKYLFLFSPVLFLALSFASWSVIPFEIHYLASPNLAILVFLAFSSLSVYGVLLGGWASNSRYAFSGALRSASQMISYELVLSLLILLVCILSQSFNFIDIVMAQTTIWFFVPLLPFVLIYMIAILAETNRTPFDLPEAEAELVAGYSVEYSSGPFAFYFIAEYCNLIIWSNITVILFFGGWLSTTLGLILPPYVIFALKSLFILLLFCWIRAALPRYRWDQLLVLAWRIYLPLVLAAVFWVSMLAIIFLKLDYTNNVSDLYIGIFMAKVDKKNCLICKKLLSYYAVFVRYIRSFLIRFNKEKFNPQIKKIYYLIKQNHFNKILLLYLILIFSTNNIAFCGTASSNFPTMEQAEQLIRLLDRDEINEFNRQMNLGLQDYQNSLQNTTTQRNPLIQTLLLALAINATVIFIARYGTTIWDALRDFAINAAGSISEFLLEQARVAAINRIRTLTPEQLNTATNILNNIIENRPQTGGAA